jgi:hypothetical protein
MEGDDRRPRLQENGKRGGYPADPAVSVRARGHRFESRALARNWRVERRPASRFTAREVGSKGAKVPPLLQANWFDTFCQPRSKRRRSQRDNPLARSSTTGVLACTF